MSMPDWDAIESRFRRWSFDIYYQRSFAGESDLTLRFAKALIASSQPIRDRGPVLAWYQQRYDERGRRRRSDADPSTLPA